MKKHYCPICLKPKIIAWCEKHGTFYAVAKRSYKNLPNTLTRSEMAKLLKENRKLTGPRKPRRYRAN